MEGGDHHLVAVRLDTASLAAPSANSEHERRIAIFDLLEQNEFRPADSDHGPYELELALADGRLNFRVLRSGDEATRTYSLALGPLKRIIKDYFLVCESYYEAIRSASVGQIEAIDMGRRGLHDEAGEILRDRLAGKIDMDRQTARRLFTLICALLRRVGPL